MKKLITTVLCSAVAGLTIFSAPKIAGQAYAQSQYAYTTVSTQSSSISYADEIDEMVETGTFDSSSLTKEQIALINKKIRRRSTGNSGASEKNLTASRILLWLPLIPASMPMMHSSRAMTL